MTPTLPLRKRRGGGKEGEKAYLPQYSSLAKSTDPNLEAEAPFAAVWLKEREVRPGNRLRCIFACSEGAGTFGAYSRLRCPSGLGVVRPTSSSSILREWSRSTCYGGWRRCLHGDAAMYHNRESQDRQRVGVEPSDTRH